MSTSPFPSIQYYEAKASIIRSKVVVGIFVISLFALAIPLTVVQFYRNTNTGSSAEALTSSTDNPPVIPYGSPMYAPEPQRVNTGDYLLGAWFFSGWKWGQNSRWRIVENYTSDPTDQQKRLVLLNDIPQDIRYPDELPWVMDYDIDWAVEHGVGVFNFDWYWDSPTVSPAQGGQGHESTIEASTLDVAEHAFLQAHYSSLMRFSLYWTNELPNWPIRWGNLDGDQMVAYWVKEYFPSRSYLYINDEPVIYVGNYQNLVSELGGITQAKDFIQHCRDDAKTDGYKGIYFIDTEIPNATNLQLGFDAFSRYGEGAAGKALDAYTAPYDTIATGYWTDYTPQNPHSIAPSADKEWVNAVTTLAPHSNYIPAISSGLDERPEEKQLQRTDNNIEGFNYQLYRAKTFVDNYSNATFTVRSLPNAQHQLVDEKMKMINIYAWNENIEAQSINPTRGYGFAFLESIRNFFAEAPIAHINTWIQEGVLHQQTIPNYTPNNMLYESYAQSGTGYDIGNKDWRNYSMKAQVQVAFQANGSGNFGVQVRQIGTNYVYIYIQRDGIYAQSYAVNKPVGEILTLLKFGTDLPITSSNLHNIQIDAWNGNINVVWDGQFGATVNPAVSGNISAVNPYGGIEFIGKSMKGLLYRHISVVGI